MTYTEVAIAYAKGAVADKKHKKHGLLIRQAARRFLDDLERTDGAFSYVEERAEHACEFVEMMPHVEGRWDSPTVTLHPAQVFFLCQLFGFRKPDGARRFSTALYATARKSGKSTLAAAIMLYCMCHEDEPGAQLISAATTYDQASIIFRVAKQMCQKEHDLREAFGIDVWSKAVTRFETGASFKALHAKASTQDGLNPSHVALDEIHAHKTADLLNVLTSAAGARANPLWLYTTTEGYDSPGPWAEIRKFAKDLLAGKFGHDADHYLAIFFAVDDENKELGVKQDDEFDESAWVKANPLIDQNPVLLDAIRKEAVEAKQMPSKLAEFRIKRLNRPSASADSWLNLTEWNKCSGAVDLEWLSQYPCYAGMDLASTSDITAFRLVWRVDGVIYTHGWRWVPGSAVDQRTERGTTPYAAWVNGGLIEETEGNVTDYAKVEAAIVEICERFKPESIAYDPWNARDLVNRLVERELPMVEFVQGTKSYHPAMQAIERAYMDGKLAHGGDPVLTWCAGNVVAKTDQNLNNAPDKKRSADKIDDFCALAMATGILIAAEPDEPEYTMMVL